MNLTEKRQDNEFLKPRDYLLITKERERSEQSEAK